MLTQLVLVSAASFMTWQLLKTVLFFQIPGRLAPFIVLASSFIWSFAFSSNHFLLAFAGSAGVALIIKIIGVEGPEPWKFPSVKKPVMKKPRTYPPGSPPSIPRAKRTDIGSRIPDLP